MRFRTKAAIMTALAGPAIAGLILTGAGPANAAVTAANTPHASADPIFGFCSPFNLERFDFRGDNTVDVTFNNTPFTYAVDFFQRGSCLGGSLTDTHIPSGPQTGPIHGFVFRNYVRFSFTYTYVGETQGTRTYVGTISRRGFVSGTWSDSGPDGSMGTWSLADRVQRACPNFFPWFGFFEFGNGCPVPFPFQFFNF
jgi:hypothetical protein